MAGDFSSGAADARGGSVAGASLDWAAHARLTLRL
jgi:hypothetical protein